jgi:hypothetical protein
MRVDPAYAAELVVRQVLGAATAPQRFQITTDGFAPHISAITTRLSDRSDYAQPIRAYGQPVGEEHRHSPPEVLEALPKPIMGDPERAKTCTSHIERQNLTIRMRMSRMTRLTSAFSNKWGNLWSAYYLHFAFYNFCRIHKNLRVTPAMEGGDHGAGVGIGGTAGSSRKRPNTTRKAASGEAALFRNL